MATKVFNVSLRPEIEARKLRVVTAYGEPVEIVKWDCKGRFPVLACIDDGDTSDAAFYAADGKDMSGQEGLFILEAEPGTTPGPAQADPYVKENRRWFLRVGTERIPCRTKRLAVGMGRAALRDGAADVRLFEEYDLFDRKTKAHIDHKEFDRSILIKD